MVFPLIYVSTFSKLTVEEKLMIAVCTWLYDAKSFIYRSRAVKEKATSKICQICTAFTIHIKPLPSVGGRHLLLNCRRRRTRNPSLFVKCEHSVCSRTIWPVIERARCEHSFFGTILLLLGIMCHIWLMAGSPEAVIWAVWTDGVLTSDRQQSNLRYIAANYVILQANICPTASLIKKIQTDLWPHHL